MLIVPTANATSIFFAIVASFSFLLLDDDDDDDDDDVGVVPAAADLFPPAAGHIPDLRILTVL